MVNTMCLFAWATGPGYLVKRYSGCSTRVFLDEIYNSIGRFGVKQTALLQCAWTSSNQLKVFIEQKDEPP